MILSIITINFNNECGLKKTIKSIISQTYKEFEWIIIDGKSSDKSINLIKKYQNYISFWLSEKDKGIYDAMNKGIAHSHGRYLLFLNSGDIFFSNNTLSKVIPKLKDSDFYLGFEKTVDRRKGPLWSNQLYLNYYLIFKSFPHQATFIKKDLFFKYGFYNTSFKIVSDWLFNFRAVALDKSRIKILNFDVCFCDINGISHKYFDLASKERKLILQSLNLNFSHKIFYNIKKLDENFIPLKKFIFKLLKKSIVFYVK